MRRVLLVILIVVAIAAVGASVGFGAYHMGYDNGLSDSGRGAVVPVHDGYWNVHPGFGLFPGFFVFPVLAVVVILLVASRRRWHRGPWGWAGNMPDGCAPYGPRAVFDDWHRQAHANQSQTPPAPEAGNRNGAE